MSLSNSTAGLLFLVLAGTLNARFALPMKFTTRCAWENTWLVWSVYSLLLLPAIAVFMTIPSAAHLYHVAGSQLVVVALFGIE